MLVVMNLLKYLFCMNGLQLPLINCDVKNGSFRCKNKLWSCEQLLLHTSKLDPAY